MVTHEGVEHSHATAPNHVHEGKASGYSGNLITWKDLHHWQQDNLYILTHYRPASYSFQRSILSLFYIHNEFFNVYTHLLGAVLFLFISSHLYITVFNPPAYYESPSSPYTAADVLAFSFFFLGALFCLTISAFFHLTSNHSPNVARFGNQLDYVGIVALITGSFIPSVYYGFYCDPYLQKIYFAMISTLAVGCTTVSVTPKFRSPLWRPFRAGMFVAMGLSAVFPVIHGIAEYGLQQMEWQIGLSYVVMQGFLYILGAGLYAARVPERLKPGKFDVVGSSHQIFHVLVVLAAMTHLVGLLRAAQHAHTVNRCQR